MAKAYNKKGKEIGRTNVIIDGNKDDANFDYMFDKRTDIGYRNKITIE